jgi:hypothetical protein
MNCKCENCKCKKNINNHECNYEADGYGFKACIICRKSYVRKKKPIYGDPLLRVY